MLSPPLVGNSLLGSSRIWNSSKSFSVYREFITLKVGLKSRQNCLLLKLASLNVTRLSPNSAISFPDFSFPWWFINLDEITFWFVDQTILQCNQESSWSNDYWISLAHCTKSYEILYTLTLSNLCEKIFIVLKPFFKVGKLFFVKTELWTPK